MKPTKNKIKKVIAVYPGRFQPMGKHHAETFKWIQNKFGTSNSFIATSDKTESKSPFSFNEKKQIASAHGFKNVVKVKNPYKPDEITKKFDPKTTAVVLIVGEKDLDRLTLGKFLHKYDDNPTIGISDGAYVLVAPHISLKVPGYGEMSGTAIRTALGASLPVKDRKELFKHIFGFTDDKIYKLITNKLVKESVYSYSEIMEIKQSILTEAEKKSEAEKALLQKIKYKDDKGKQRTTTVGSVLHYGEKHPQYKKAKSMYDKAKSEKKADDKGPDKKEEPPTKLTATDLQTPQEKQTSKENEPAAKEKSMYAKFKAAADKDGDGELSAKEVVSHIKDSIKNWSNDEKKFFTDGQHKPGSESRRTIGQAIKDKAKGIVKGVKREFEHQKHTWKTGVSAIGKAIDGQKLDDHDKKALKEIGKTVALTVGSMVLTGGIGSLTHGGAGTVAKHLAAHLAEHVAGDIAILGFGKAALFANVNPEDEDYILTQYINKIADVIENGKIPPQVLAAAIEDYNKSKGKSNDANVSDAGELDIEETIFSKNWWGDIINEIESDLDTPTITTYKKKVDEDITIPINIGDTVLGGKFKNKKIVVKTIGKNEKGEVTINGKPLLRYRLLQKENKSINESLLLEGGAYGHMSHPFDDKELTFGDIKQMIDMGLQGTLDIEQSVSEKTDGQNIMVTWKDGKLRAARNKSQIKSPIDAKALKSMFAGRGNIEKAFVYAMTDLEKAIGSLSDKQREKVFGSGNTFMNLEIIYPATENVINYDAAVLQFHGTITYDTNGNPMDSNKESARMLQGMISQVNADVQDHFKIIKPQVLTINPHQDYSAKRKYFLSKLQKLQSKFKLSDNDTLALYHQKWWETHISAQAKKFKYTMPNNILVALVNRWAFNDKSQSIVQLKKQINNDRFNDWMADFDKTKVTDIVKQNMLPFELLIFELGTEILKNVDGFLSANPSKSVKSIKDKISKAISDVKSGGDVKKLNTLKTQLAKIDAIGGFNAIVPSEGLVFIYKGKTYKITGAFGPVNQIVGLMTF